MEKDSKQTKKTILRVFIAIYVVILLLLSIITVVSTIRFKDLAFGNKSYYIMRTDSKPDVAQRGDLVIVKKVDAKDMKIGDDIVYGGNKTYYCDDVAKVEQVNIVNNIIIAENNGISYKFEENEIQGIVVKVIPKVGNIIKFFRTPFGIILFLILDIGLFVLLRVAITYSKEK